jgi:O-acetylserine/cysteine efflux transporter
MEHKEPLINPTRTPDHASRTPVGPASDPISRAPVGESPSQPVWLAPRDLLFLVFINLIWGFNLIAAKVGVGEFPPLFFTALRFGLVLACLCPLLRIFPGQMRRIFIAVLLSGAVQFALLFVGLQVSNDVSTAAIAGQLGVPFTTLLSVWLLGEVIHWKRKLGIVLAFGGILLMSFEPRVLQYWPGVMLVIASSLCGSLGLIFIKHCATWVRCTCMPGSPRSVAPDFC